MRVRARARARARFIKSEERGDEWVGGWHTFMARKSSQIKTNPSFRVSLACASLEAEVHFETLYTISAPYLHLNDPIFTTTPRFYI